MDWNALKVFLAIEQQGSLSGAARVLGVNHSTVFRRLNAFEQDVGGRLFERVQQGYQLTPLGEELLDIARRIESGFDDLDRRIVGKEIQPKGNVRITAPNNLAYHYLPGYLADFHAQYPEIKVELLVSNLELNMTNRQADIALRSTMAPPEHLVGREVRAVGWSVYGSPEYIRHHGKPRSIESLAEHVLVGASGGMRNLPPFVWLENTLPDRIAARSDDLVAMSYLAETGMGLALLPDDQRRPSLERLLPFPPGKKSNLWLLTHPDLRRMERIRLLMRHLAKALAEDARLNYYPG